jgi:hypothetical protein
MKIIYTENLKFRKNARLFDFIVEKSKGLYDKIRDFFGKGSEETKDIINDVKEKEEDFALFEKELADEEILNVLKDQDLLQDDIGEEYLGAYTDEQVDAVNSIGRDINIEYITFYTNIFIERNIRPLYTKHAKTTGNYILVSWSYDSEDFRAFVIPNILKSTEIKMR